MIRSLTLTQTFIQSASVLAQRIHFLFWWFDIPRVRPLFSSNETSIQICQTSFRRLLQTISFQQYCSHIAQTRSSSFLLVFDSSSNNQRLSNTSDHRRSQPWSQSNCTLMSVVRMGGRSIFFWENLSFLSNRFSWNLMQWNKNHSCPWLPMVVFLLLKIQTPMWVHGVRWSSLIFQTVFFESVAILHYLVSTYDVDHKLSFVYNSKSYHQAHQWLAFQSSTQGPYMGQAVWVCIIVPALELLLNASVNISPSWWCILISFSLWIIILNHFQVRFEGIKRRVSEWWEWLIDICAQLVSSFWSQTIPVVISAMLMSLSFPGQMDCIGSWEIVRISLLMARINTMLHGWDDAKKGAMWCKPWRIEIEWSLRRVEVLLTSNWKRVQMRKDENEWHALNLTYICTASCVRNWWSLMQHDWLVKTPERDEICDMMFVDVWDCWQICGDDQKMKKKGEMDATKIFVTPRWRTIELENEGKGFLGSGSTVTEERWRWVVAGRIIDHDGGKR